MQVAKTFDRNGIRYRSGDPLPEGLDKTTLEHYKRHGMVREVKPEATKPVAPRRRTAQEPKHTKPAGPANTADLMRSTGAFLPDNFGGPAQETGSAAERVEAGESTAQPGGAPQEGGASGEAASADRPQA